MNATRTREARNLFTTRFNSPKTRRRSGSAGDVKAVAAVVEKLDEHRARIAEEGTLSERRRRNLRNEVLALATARLRARLEEAIREDERFAGLLDEVVARRLDPASAAARILERFDAEAPAR